MIPDELLELMRLQSGAVRHEQALAYGGRRRDLGPLGSGRPLVSLRRGAYVLRSTYESGSLAQRTALTVAAEQVTTGVPMVAVGATAALIHDLPVLGRTDRLELREPCDERPRHHGRSASLDPNDVVTVRGVQVTTPARTVVDLARGRGFAAGTVTADAALRRGVPLVDLERAAQRLAGRSGIRAARQAIAFADGRSESALESLGRVRFHESGLPAPRLQVVIADADGPFAWVDHCWEEQRTVAEADGALKYAAADALFAEKRREDRLREAGFEVVRYTWGEALHHPDVVIARIRRAFARAARRAA